MQSVHKLRRRLKSRNGSRKIKEKIHLREPITLDMFEQACMLLALDPDAVRSDLNTALAALQYPPITNMQAFMDLVVRRPERWQLKDMTLEGAQQVVSLCAAFFLTESLMRLNGLTPSARASMNALASNWMKHNTSRPSSDD